MPWFLLINIWRSNQIRVFLSSGSCYQYYIYQASKLLSTCSKNLKHVKMKPNTSRLFTLLFLSTDTLQCMASEMRCLTVTEDWTQLTLLHVLRSRSSLFSSSRFTPWTSPPACFCLSRKLDFLKHILVFLFFLWFSYCSVILITQPLPSFLPPLAKS